MGCQQTSDKWCELKVAQAQVFLRSEHFALRICAHHPMPHHSPKIVLPVQEFINLVIWFLDILSQ